MKLKNRFSQETKQLFFEKRYSCMHPNCGSNEMVTLHHIRSTSSDSPLNGICLCHPHHSAVGHTFEEEKEYLQITIKYILRQNYKLTEDDCIFYNLNKKYYDKEKQKVRKMYKR